MKVQSIIETLKIKIRRFYYKKTANLRLKRIKKADFTIISNNCWGGFVYQSYGLQYNTPTIGMYFMAKDFIKFIKNIEDYLNNELEFINPIDSKWYEQVKNNHNYGNYPVARLKDIELFFMHYTDEKEVIEKWNSRKKRINYSRILYKFSEMNNCDKEDIISFQKLNLKNKICFISKQNSDLENSYTITCGNKVDASDEPIGNSCLLNVNELINRME